MSIQNYQAKLLTAKEVKTLAGVIEPQYSTSFTDKYQSRCKPEHPQYYSLATLLECVERSEQVFCQYEKDERNIKAIARSIFVDADWLRVAPSVAIVNGEMYLYAGRHRLAAIVGVFYQIAYVSGTSNEEREELFETLLGQEVMVTVNYLDIMDDLLQMVLADNDTRTIRKSEQVHLESQLYGAEADSVSSALEVAFSFSDDPKRMRDTAAQYFTRQHSDKLTRQTRQLVGERIAHHILFGDVPLNKKTRVAVSLEDASTAFAYAWSLTKEITKDDKVLARNVKGIADKVLYAMSAKGYEKRDTEVTEF